MYTDWLLVRRLALELNDRFAGARVQDVGRLEDGRLALALWKKGRTALVCIDPFAPTPLVTAQEGELPIAPEPGFVRAAGAALRGKTLEAVRSRRGDRLLRFDFLSRSRFGVAETYSLVCELVPRFGNVVLLKGDVVVAAMKEFSLAENSVRAVHAGAVYQPPPMRQGAISPMLPDEVAAPLAEHIAAAPVYVYRRDGQVLQAHLAPLPRYSQDEVEQTGSLLDVFSEFRAGHSAATQSEGAAKLRRDLARLLDRREQKLKVELERVERRAQAAQEREGVRESGERIFATLHELPPEARDEAKRQAADLFAQYRKAGSAAGHIEKRRAELLQALEDLSQLRWDLESAQAEHLEDVAAALEDVRSERGPARAPRRRRKPLTYVTEHGSRIFVGRTPIENADLTFRVARPNDLWFHVQNQPGAHVILQRDDRTPPPQEDLLAAAALAALHSKAKNSAKVTVDYTQRKHVRKRPAAAPGLVFYTRPQSLVVSPRQPAELR